MPGDNTRVNDNVTILAGINIIFITETDDEINVILCLMIIIWLDDNNDVQSVNGKLTPP